MTPAIFQTVLPVVILAIKSVIKMNNKALIAMSGGVDSSVAAYLTRKNGFECIGVTMKLFNNSDVGVKSSKTCCSLEDTEDARSVAKRLGIPYYVFNFTAEFKTQVIDRFVFDYENGITPNPCIDCNRYLKFEKLYHRAQELGYDYVVTGHYARIVKENGRYLLKKAVDETKDQSYVLYSLSQEQLAHTMFPLGEMCKTKTRKIAESQGFYNADKPDSQDICFVPDGDYSAFIKKYTGKEYESGDFVDRNGKVLGRHKGIIGYTVGQRKGLGISAKEPLFVEEILPNENRIVLGDRNSILKKELTACDFNSIAFETVPKEFRAKAKIRYRQKEEWATVKTLGNNKIKVIFDQPQRAITKGQAVVLYDGDTVLGGGVIC